MSRIYGIGTDICDIRRIRAAWEKNGERFALKILSEAEMQTFRARSTRWPDRGVRFLATRFSVKEAFSKAIGLGMRMPMTWRLCEVGRKPSGQPTIPTRPRRSLPSPARASHLRTPPSQTHGDTTSRSTGYKT